MSLTTIEQQHFRRVCSKYATGITILTVLDSSGAPQGMTVNSFTSVSLSPPLILVCIDRQTSILSSFKLGTRFGVNVLQEEQKELSTWFARSGYDRFSGIAWSAGETGAPLLEGMLATIECVLADNFHPSVEALRRTSQITDAELERDYREWLTRNPL